MRSNPWTITRRAPYDFPLFGSRCAGLAVFQYASGSDPRCKEPPEKRSWECEFPR
ncbi:hypothetical protein CGRA01v4_00202 [Colletotrichum graminicola]|nr:hypothetical protein CGRA01v4_00202 [Colletotrichum graminicola]